MSPCCMYADAIRLSALLLAPRLAGHPRSTLFTGSKRVAEKLAKDFHGKVRGVGVIPGGGGGGGCSPGVQLPGAAGLSAAHHGQARMQCSCVPSAVSWSRAANHLPLPCLPPLRRRQIFLEDAGFDWKILGPDVHEFDYVAWQVGKAGAVGGGPAATRAELW